MRVAGVGLALIFWAVPALADFTADWSLSPSGNLSGVAGSTITWYYSINNTSKDWLTVDSLSETAPFFIGTAQQLINATAGNAPVLAPMSVDPLSTGSQLLSLHINPGATPFAKDSGGFALFFDFWNADPLTDSDANYLGSIEVDKAYSAAVIPASAVPEPSFGLVIFAATVILLALRIQRTDTRQNCRGRFGTNRLAGTPENRLHSHKGRAGWFPGKAAGGGVAGRHDFDGRATFMTITPCRQPAGDNAMSSPSLSS